MRYGAILTAIAFVLLVACKSTTPPPSSSQPPPVQYEQGPQARSTPHALFTPGVPVAPIQHSPWTTTTNDPTVTLQAQQPVSITTTSSISLYAPSLIAWTNAVNGRLNVCNTINGIAGAVGNGSTDCYASITNALAQAIAQNNALYFPPGRYLISKTITLPARTFIDADFVDPAYKSAIPKRASIKTTGDFTALQSPRLTFPNDWLPFWTQFISVHNLYIEGVLSQGTATATNTSVGLDLTGVEFADVRDVHIEGFGTGFKFRNFSELVSWNTFAQNNWLGYSIGRDRAVFPVPTYDCMGTFYNLVSLQNNPSLVLDAPRQASIIGGEFIGASGRQNISIINGNGDGAATFYGISAENHATNKPMINVDTNGISGLYILHCNFETDQDQPLVEMGGYFDSLQLEFCNLQRSTTRTNPIVWVHREAAGWPNYELLAQNIKVSGNTPNWYDTWIRNDLSSSNPAGDYVPDDHVNLNPIPTTDHLEDGIVVAGGDHSLLSTTSLSGGLGHLCYQDTDLSQNTYILITSTNSTKGLDHLYLTALLYTNGKTNIPNVNINWGTNGVDYFVLGPTLLGTWTNADSVPYDKYAWSVGLFNTSMATNGFSSVGLVNIFGMTNTEPTRGLYGIDRFSVYASKAQNQNVLLPRVPAINREPGLAALGAGVETGIRPVGWFMSNSDYTNNPAIYGWVCTEQGHPGTWAPVPAFGRPDLFGTFQGGTNTPGTFARGFGANTNWPFYVQTMYSMGSVDYYINFDCFMDGGTFDNPTFTGSNSGGRIIRIHTGNVVNDGVLDFGHTTTGTGQLFVLDMQVDSELTTNQLPILVRDNLSLTMKRILMDTNRFLYLAP